MFYVSIQQMRRAEIEFFLIVMQMIKKSCCFRKFYWKCIKLCPLWHHLRRLRLGMGVLDGFHASVPVGNTLVWLHSMAMLFGGGLFALVCLPSGIFRKC